MNAMKLSSALAVILLLAMLPAGAAFAQGDPGFMPKGGKTLLAEVLGRPPDLAELGRIVAARRSEAEWRDYFSAHKPALSEKELRTLAVYLADVLPLPPGALEAAQSKGDWSAALPMDGRDLAWNNCQGCHSIFTGYLTQDRDVSAWLGEFLAPFHRKLELTKQEREIFAHYSAINMPMKAEDVPEDLRF
jgi:hypothetical protein